MMPLIQSRHFSNEVLQKFKNHSDPIRFPDTDWIDYCFKNSSFQSQHNVNISGGIEKVRYFVSLGAYTQDGLLSNRLCLMILISSTAGLITGQI